MQSPLWHFPSVLDLLPAKSQAKVVHDAEYYILEAQNGEKWAAEDMELDQKLSGLQKKYGRLVNLIHLKSPFNRMKLRHELWKKRYPDAKEVHGIPWTGLDNPTPEIQALAKPRLDLKKVPFDLLEYVEHLDQFPFDPHMDPDLGR